MLVRYLAAVVLKHMSEVHRWNEGYDVQEGNVTQQTVNKNNVRGFTLWQTH